MIEELKNIGCSNVSNGVEESGKIKYDTIFFTINEKTDMKKLLIWLSKNRPDEFWETELNTFRAWWD